MPTIDLAAGPLDYDERGDGPTIVLLHGAHTDSSLWRGVIDELADHYRCLAPTLPMGSHRKPVAAGTPLNLAGLASIVDQFLTALDLDDVTLVGNDTGGAVAQAVAVRHPERIGRLVLASCEAFDNFPPGLPGRLDVLLGRLPGGMWQAGQLMRLGPMWRLPITFGPLAKRPIGADLREAWFGPLRSSPEIRRDTHRLLRSVDAAELSAMSERLEDFDQPALVVWATEDKVMPPAHAERLAATLPLSELVWVDDSYTLIALDQPVVLARTIRDFVGG
jgi:pimeloyl-ACP methyl ester carboxylesterase